MGPTPWRTSDLAGPKRQAFSVAFKHTFSQTLSVLKLTLITGLKVQNLAFIITANA